MSEDNTNKDIFSTVEEGFDEVHSRIERLTPTFVQSWLNFQQEYMDAWKKIICSNISSQQKFAEKIGMNSNSINLTNQMIQTMTKNVTSVMELQSKMTQTFFDVSRNHIKGVTQNSEAYSEMNKKIINSQNKIKQ